MNFEFWNVQWSVSLSRHLVCSFLCLFSHEDFSRESASLHASQVCTKHTHQWLWWYISPWEGKGNTLSMKVVYQCSRPDTILAFYEYNTHVTLLVRLTFLTSDLIAHNFCMMSKFQIDQLKRFKTQQLMQRNSRNLEEKLLLTSIKDSQFPVHVSNKVIIQKLISAIHSICLMPVLLLSVGLHAVLSSADTVYMYIVHLHCTAVQCKCLPIMLDYMQLLLLDNYNGHVHWVIFQMMAICIDQPMGRGISLPWQFLQFLPGKTIIVMFVLFCISSILVHVCICQWSQVISDDLLFLHGLCIVLVNKNLTMINNCGEKIEILLEALNKGIPMKT